MKTQPPELGLSPIGGLSARFQSSEDERNYREANLVAERRQGSVLILLLSVPLLAMAGVDYLFLGASAQFFFLLTARAALGLLSVALLSARRLRSSVRRLDWAHGSWMALAYLLTVVANAVVPADFSHHIILDVLLMLTISIVLPLPFWIVAFGTATFAAAEMAVLTFAGHVDSAMAAGVWWVSVVYGGAAGLAVGNWFRRSSRAGYQALIREQKLLAEIDETLSGVRTLRGLLPQCRTCPGNDHATWEEIEKFVTKHTDARFSHGVCPPCAGKLYPELNLDDSAD